MEPKSRRKGGDRRTGRKLKWSVARRRKKRKGRRRSEETNRKGRMKRRR